MGLRQNKEGNYIFSYALEVVPCRQCGSTNIELYEIGGKTPSEHKKGLTEGGGVCKVCGNTVHVIDIPPVPSITMLLNVCNINNKQ